MSNATNNPTRPLGEVATIFSGITESRLEGSEAVPVLTAGSFDKNSLKPLAELEKKNLKASKSVEQSRLREGDVLLVARGALKIAIVGEATAGAVLGGNLICVRPDRGLLLPGFLHAFLDMPETREHLRQRSASTTGILMIKVETLRGLMVSVPAAPAQQSFATLAQTFETYHRVSLQLVEQRRLTLQAALRALVAPCLGGA